MLQSEIHMCSFHKQPATGVALEAMYCWSAFWHV